MTEALGIWGEVDFLVVGNSPGGVWLFSHLPELYGEATKMGWLREETNPRPLYVPTSAVKTFALQGTTPVCSEVLWPLDGLTWSTEAVAARFPKLPLATLTDASEALLGLTPHQWGRGLLNTKSLDPIRSILRAYPELLGVADAYWKLFGKSESVQVETKLWSLFNCLSLEEWKPEAQIPPGVQPFVCRELSQSIESVRQTADGLWEIKVKGRGTLHTKNLVLALSVRQLRELSSAFKFSRLPWESALSHPVDHGLYPLKITLESDRVPAPMRDLTFLLDSFDIPEPDSEIWPIEKRKLSDPSTTELTFWVTGRFDNCLDSLSESFKQAALRLNELLPFASRSIKQFSPGLQFDECGDDEKRMRTLEAMSESFLERYSFSIMEPRTRWKTLFFLGPYFYTQWPYPLGELRAAEVIKHLLAPKKKAVVVAPSVPSV